MKYYKDKNGKVHSEFEVMVVREATNIAPFTECDAKGNEVKPKEEVLHYFGSPCSKTHLFPATDWTRVTCPECLKHKPKSQDDALVEELAKVFHDEEMRVFHIQELHFVQRPETWEDDTDLNLRKQYRSAIRAVLAKLREKGWKSPDECTKETIVALMSQAGVQDPEGFFKHSIKRYSFTEQEMHDHDGELIEKTWEVIYEMLTHPYPEVQKVLSHIRGPQ